MSPFRDDRGHHNAEVERVLVITLLIAVAVTAAVMTVHTRMNPPTPPVLRHAAGLTWLGDGELALSGGAQARLVGSASAKPAATTEVRP